MFVKSRHRSQKLFVEGARLPAEEVRQANDPADIMRFTEPFGTTSLEGTCGFHKRDLPPSKLQLLLLVGNTPIPSGFI